MKRSELKKLIKPLVKECVQETILNDGLLSNIVSEVAQGMGNQFLVENKEQVVPAMSNENSVRMEAMRAQKKEQLLETKKKLLDAIGKDAYGGVDIFEGTTPAPAQRSPEHAAANPLADVDPGDSGVDISGIVALGGKNWKALIG
tara:strand:+ start:1103 stop:1537 length:435 start_codon:yes stop_codon:yes gene_type:complete